jgi:uncharacterized protein YgbK (DUF1537 family)
VTPPRPVIGCIADDITGATDLAGLLADDGLPTLQLFGVPTRPLDERVGAVVIALKTRTAPAAEACARSRLALSWLRGQGIDRCFVKYCSTFDSTPAGNIGPVTDALLGELEHPMAVHCPSYPANRRTVYQGHLFVGSALLNESGMQHHPLTPMTDANLVRVLQAQTPRRVALLPLETVRRGAAAVTAEAERLRREGAVHLIADATSDDDLAVIATATADTALPAGGAAFGLGVARTARPAGEAWRGFAVAAPPGRSAVLAGSAAQATQRQIDAFARRFPVMRIPPASLTDAEGAVAAALGWAARQDPMLPILIAVDARPDALAAARALLGESGAAERVEQVLADIARGLPEQDVRRIVVAGGETSGAVAAALAVERVVIGKQVTTGVPWTFSAEPRLALAFKSGNFGSDEFFTEAFALLDGGT